MLGTPRRDFYFWKISVSEILRHAHFEEIALLFIFGQNVHPDTQSDTQEALRRTLAGSQEAVRRHPGAPGAGSPRQAAAAHGINWKASWELGITARTPTV